MTLKTNLSLVVSVAAVVLLVLLALIKLVHVGVAHFTAVLLNAGHQLLLEAIAGTLVLLPVSSRLLLLGVLGLLLLLLLSGGLVVATTTTMATTATHHGANGLVTDLAAGTESHTRDHSAHKTTTAEAHTLRLRRLCSGRLTRGSPRGSCSPGRAGTGEHTTATTASAAEHTSATTASTSGA